MYSVHLGRLEKHTVPISKSSVISYEFLPFQSESGAPKVTGVAGVTMRFSLGSLAGAFHKSASLPGVVLARATVYA